MENKDILDYLRLERENLLLIIGGNMSEFNKGRIYAMDKMIEAINGIYFYEEK